ncbi:hypothetical protein C8F01DRAFT_1158624 [Mycena amicta]|nr:hypothetical protein C8F01DRAFT_1158624 [Mycena amicta]
MTPTPAMRQRKPPNLKKSVQFSDKNLLYSPIAWSPQLDPGVSSLPPSPMPTNPSFPPDVIRDDTDSEPERMPAAPSYDSSAVVPAPPLKQVWTPPIVYSPWGPALELPSTPYMGMLWPPPPSPSPPPLYIPWQPQQPIHLHILLAFTPFAPPTLSFDVAQSPHIQLQVSHTAYLEPATHPPLSCLLLRCRRLPLADWSIPVVPLTQPTTGIVCVLDVLRAVYISLRASVHRPEYETLDIVTRADVDSAYFARCKAVTDPHLRRAEERKGVKRVDVLCRKTRFLGLSGPLEAGPGVWELNLAE